MINDLGKRACKAAFRRFGFEIRRTSFPVAGSASRPTADMVSVIEDLKARGFRPKAVLDVGANRGLWTRSAHQIFPDAYYLMVEPQPEMKPDLDSFCQEFPRSHWVLGAVGAQPGELTQTIWEDLAGSSFLVPVEEKLLANGKQRLVQIFTIDSLYSESDAQLPELVKLDIQGFELEALKGASKLFGFTEVFILEISLFEFEPAMPILSEVVSFMRERNYETYDIAGFLRRPSDGALGQIDFVFVKADGFLRQSNRW